MRPLRKRGRSIPSSQGQPASRAKVTKRKLVSTSSRPSRLGRVARTTSTTGYTRSAPISKILYSPNIGFPEKMNVRLAFCESVTLSGGSPFYQNRIYRLNSMFKPSGATAVQPQDYDSLTPIYTRFHVYKTECTVKLWSQTDSTAEDTYGAITGSNLTTLTLSYQSLVAMPRCQTCVFPNQNTDVVKELKYQWLARDVFANPWDDDIGHTWDADPTTLHYLIVRGGAVQGSQAFSMVATVHMVFHAVCSRRTNTGLD